MTNSTYYLTGSDGTNIAFDDVQYTIIRDGLNGFASYPAEYEITQTPGVVGGRVVNTIVGEREVSFNVVIWGDGRAQLEARRRALVKALNPLLGYCKFYWQQENGNLYYLVCRPSEGYPSFDNGTAHDAKFWQCNVTMTCADPCWMASEETKHTLISDDVGFNLPLQIPFTLGMMTLDTTIHNEGSAPAPALMELHGPLTSPITLQNVTSGENITVKHNVLAGDTLTIDTDRNDIRVTYYNHTTGTTTNAMSYCSVGSKFWQLIPGDNLIHVDIFDIGDGASATLTFRERQVAL